MNKVLWRCAAGVAGAVLAVVCLTVPAQAADSTVVADSITPAAVSDCPPTYYCVWVNTDYNDGPGKWAGNQSNYTAWPHSGCGILSLWTWDNCASSVFNHGQSCNMTLYDGINYTGAYFRLDKGSQRANLKLNKMSDGGNMNDRISSHYWCNY